MCALDEYGKFPNQSFIIIVISGGFKVKLRVYKQNFTSDRLEI